MSKTVIYYIVIALILVSKTGYTLYQKSLVVHHGVSVNGYHQEQRQLLREKTELLAELAKYRSISSIKTSSQVAEYTPIKNVLVITSDTSVASLP